MGCRRFLISYGPRLQPAGPRRGSPRRSCRGVTRQSACARHDGAARARPRPDERYNEVAKSSMDYCVQGTFKFESMVKGHGDIRWLSVEELAASGYSKEQFETLTGKYIKELQKRFKRDAKAFKSKAQQRRARK